MQFLWSAVLLLLPLIAYGADYSIGEPTAQEQLMLSYINRCRANPTEEGKIIANTTDPDVTSAISYFHVDLNAFKTAMAAYSSQPPLAFHFKLVLAARNHSNYMQINQVQDHGEASTNGGFTGANPGVRITYQGYTWYSYGENIYAYANSVWYAHCGFVVDWGGTAADGMQSPPGHRNNYMSASNTEAGVGILPGTGSVGPLIVTHNFAKQASPTTFLVGVVFSDTVTVDNFYTIGEGVSGAAISCTGVTAWTATSTSAGSFTLPIPTSGTITCTAVIGSLTATQSFTLAAKSVQWDINTRLLSSGGTSTPAPTKSPTNSPTLTPTKAPTLTTPAPTKAPTLAPTTSPTSKAPTLAPTKAPTTTTKAPTKAPTLAPTKAPTSTKSPTKSPTNAPTKTPTNPPSKKRTAAPTTPAPTVAAAGTTTLPLVGTVKTQNAVIGGAATGVVVLGAAGATIFMVRRRRRADYQSRRDLLMGNRNDTSSVRL